MPEGAWRIPSRAASPAFPRHARGQRVHAWYHRVLKAGYSAISPARALAMYLVVPVFEELLYRGVLVKRLLYALDDTTRTRVLSGCASAVLFALTHPRYPSHKLIPGVALVALVLASNKKERTLVPAIVAHIAVNVLFSIARVPF